VLNQIPASQSGLTIYSFLAQAATLIRGKRNIDAEAQAVLESLAPESTLQGDTILWQLEASTFELKTVLDERTATQNALLELDRQLDEFERAA
jgi:hypothetical protein